jgi:hypothetical protein
VNKAIGVLVIGLGLILIAIGTTGTQSQVLADLKSVNPKLRQAATQGSNTGTVINTNSGGSQGPQNAGAAPTQTGA